MSNVFDYLQWRGDLTFAQDAFRAPDALIFSRLSYLPLEDIVPTSFGKNVTLSFVSLAFSAEEKADDILWKQDPKLLAAAAACKRYENVRLCGYVNELDDDRTMQFSAVVFMMEDNRRFIAFRGTDASFTGWEEEFRMFTSYTLPSQLRALQYLESASRSTNARLLLGGHSKGGNLALFSAMNCDLSLQNRIDAIYNFDGPGFRREYIESERFARIRNRAHTFVPQSSVFGMMLEHDEEFAIVQSSGKSVMQHDIYRWQLMGGDFVYLDRRTNSGYFINHTLESFLEKMTDEEREQFIQAFFTVVRGSNSAHFREIPQKLLSNTASMLRAFKKLNKSERVVLGKSIFKALESAKENLSDIRPDQ